MGKKTDGGRTAIGLLGVAMILLKLAGILDWSWWYAFAIVAIYAIFFVFYWLAALVKKLWIAFFAGPMAGKLPKD